MKVLAAAQCLALAIVVTSVRDLLLAMIPDQPSPVVKAAEDIVRTVKDEEERAHILTQFAVGYARRDV